MAGPAYEPVEQIVRATRHDVFTKYRQHIVPAAEGRVLEIGIGSGRNRVSRDGTHPYAIRLLAWPLR